MNVQSLPVTTFLSIYFAEMPRVNKGVIEKWAISFSLFHKVDIILSSYSRRPISLGFSVRHYKSKRRSRAHSLTMSVTNLNGQKLQ